MSYEDRFNYHRHLERIALDDVEFLKKKDRSYGASWKESGRSAWFMMKRMIDRLVNMMRRPDAPDKFNYDSARQAAFSLDQNGLLSATRSEPTLTRDILHTVLSYDAEDLLTRLEREELDGHDGTVTAVLRDLRRYCLLAEAEITERLEKQISRRDEDVDQRIIENFMKRNPLYPFVVNDDPGLDDAWYQRRSNKWFLRPVVRDEALVPHEVCVYYRLVNIGNDCCVRLLEIGKCPPSIRDSYPRLRDECNQKELQLLEDWQQGLYEWFEDEGKWRIKSEHKDWTR